MCFEQGGGTCKETLMLKSVENHGVCRKVGNAYLLWLCKPVFIEIRASSESLDRSGEFEASKLDGPGLGNGSKRLGWLVSN